jgi:hypothetical protein
MPHAQIKFYVSVGQRVLIECPHSEVCTHMRIAGRLMFAELLRSEGGFYSVQLWNGARDEDGMFSFPIGAGEAGMYYEEVEGGIQLIYYYPPIYKIEELAERIGPVPDNSGHGG